jgi:hypothetical protein
MMKTLRNILKESRKHSEIPSQGKVVVTRSESGHYYIGTSFVNSISTSHSDAERSAIEDMTKNEVRPVLTDIFILDVDLDAMQSILADDPDAPIDLNTTNGEARDLIAKTGPKKNSATPAKDLFDHELSAEMGANVHIISLNDPKHFNRSRDMNTYALGALLPHRFINPKSLMGHSSADSGAYDLAT